MEIFLPGANTRLECGWAARVDEVATDGVNYDATCPTMYSLQLAIVAATATVSVPPQYKVVWSVRDVISSAVLHTWEETSSGLGERHDLTEALPGLNLRIPVQFDGYQSHQEDELRDGLQLVELVGETVAA